MRTKWDAETWKLPESKVMS